MSAAHRQGRKPNYGLSISTPCLQVSIVEVYNECVYDLLVPPSEGHDKLQIQKRGKDVVVPVSGSPSKYCVPSIIW